MKKPNGRSRDLPVVLAGQSNLVDNLRYRNCLPLASRVVACADSFP